LVLLFAFSANKKPQRSGACCSPPGRPQNIPGDNFSDFQGAIFLEQYLDLFEKVLFLYFFPLNFTRFKTSSLIQKPVSPFLNQLSLSENENFRIEDQAFSLKANFI